MFFLELHARADINCRLCHLDTRYVCRQKVILVLLWYYYKLYIIKYIIFSHFEFLRLLHRGKNHSLRSWTFSRGAANLEEHLADGSWWRPKLC